MPHKGGNDKLFDFESVEDADFDKDTDELEDDFDDAMEFDDLDDALF